MSAPSIVSPREEPIRPAALASPLVVVEPLPSASDGAWSAPDPFDDVDIGLGRRDSFARSDSWGVSATQVPVLPPVSDAPAAHVDVAAPDSPWWDLLLQGDLALPELGQLSQDDALPTVDHEDI